MRSLGHPSSSAEFLVAFAKCRRSGNAWLDVAKSGKLRARVTLHPSPPRHWMSLVLSVFDGLQSYLSEASHSLWPRYHHRGLTEKCVKVRERPSSHRPVTASILCFMAWPSDNTKFELDYLSYFEILVAARQITLDILDFPLFG